MQKKLQQLGWYVWLLLVIISPTSTKVAGTAWVMAIVWSFWLARTAPILEANTPGTQALYRATTFILWSFVLAFVLRTLGQTYWWDSWEFRHFDIRMLLTAIALYIFARRVRPSMQVRYELITALSLASILALYVSFRLIKGLSIPTTIIPWAFGMVLFAIVLASVHFTTKVASRAHIATLWLSTLGVLVLLAAVLISGVRGAYFAVVWVFGILLFSLFYAIQIKHLKNKYLWLSCIAVAVSLGVLIKTVPQVYEIPKQRITIALAEIYSFHADKRNTSVGLRLHFVEKGTTAFLEKPWIGYGIEQRNKLVNQWSAEVDPSLIDMTHSHNEYLNAVLDYGLLGAAATLAYLIGLIFATVALWRTNRALSVSLAGICFATTTTFLTNANGLHNFTSVSLGLALVYALVIFMPRNKENETAAIAAPT